MSDRILGVVGKTLAFAVLACPRAALAQVTSALSPGVAVERTIAPGEVHDYEIPLLAGQFLHLDVEQIHLDAVVRALSPDKTILAQVDNAVDREEPLSLSLVTPRDEKVRVEIRLRGPKSVPGRYRLTAQPPHAAVPEDRQRVEAERSLAQADQLVTRGTADFMKQALESYEKVLAAWREIGDPRMEAGTLGRMSDALGELGDLRPALARADEALARWRQINDPRGVAAALSRLGLAYSEVGEQRKGLEYLEQALALRRTQGNLRGQAETLNDMAVALGALGQKPEAIARYTEALELTRSAGDRVMEAMLLKNRAVDHASLGETERALADLKVALTRFREIGDRHLEGVTQYSIGCLFLDRNELPEALRRYQLALPILRETGDKRFEGFTYNHIGLVHLAAGKPRPALEQFELARKILHECKDQRAEAMILANIGRTQLELGDAREARDRLQEALPQVRATGDRMHEAKTLVHLARAEKALGDLEGSRTQLEEALRLTESLRGSIPAVGDRAAFMAQTRDRYDLLISVLMDLDARQPGHGWAAEGLRASERAKARSLIELLAEARIDLREGLDETLLEQERSLEAQIDARRREEELRLTGGTPPAPDPGRRPLDALLAESDDVMGRLRAANPRYIALARLEPLTLTEIRRQVLNDDTLLLEYELGDERSFLWAATPEALVSRELPRRAVIEEAARRLYRAWSTTNAAGETETNRRARALSRMLLGPVADLLGKKRLAVVVEGALQYIPFAALPEPDGAPSVPLVARHEVVSLPSATTLSVLRAQAAGRRPPQWQVAVLADPVFDRMDPRVHGARRSSKAPESASAGSDALTRSMQESGLRRLERLTASRREAETIAALAGPAQSFTALDFRASRDTALSADVANARIVHFASHGLLNTRHPDLSGIVLSLVDENGRPEDGFLQTRDIYKLRLAADLVVLSACQTALGKDVRGEGLLGLSRGFMYAGAPRVLASLWQVPDRATAELMKRFYRGILAEGLRPAAALRAAQMSIRKERLWSSPYYWAAFTLEGDWN